MRVLVTGGSGLLGRRTIAALVVGGHEVVARTDGLSSLRAGDQVSLVPKPTGVHLFDAETGARLVA